MWRFLSCAFCILHHSGVWSVLGCLYYKQATQFGIWATTSWEVKMSLSLLPLDYYCLCFLSLNRLWKVAFLWRVQPVVLLLTAFSSRPVGWFSQLATGQMPADHEKRLSSAEQITFGCSRQWTIWKWLCSFLRVNLSCERFLKMSPFSAKSCRPIDQQLLGVPCFSVTWHLLSSDVQDLAFLPAFSILENGI